MATFDSSSHVDAVKTDHRFTTCSVDVKSIAVKNVNLRTVAVGGVFPSLNCVLAVLDDISVNLNAYSGNESTKI